MTEEIMALVAPCASCEAKTVERDEARALRREYGHTLARVKLELEETERVLQRTRDMYHEIIGKVAKACGRKPEETWEVAMLRTVKERDDGAINVLQVKRLELVATNLLNANNENGRWLLNAIEGAYRDVRR